MLVSHNHYDHLDIDALVKIDKAFSPLFLVGLGDKALLTKKGIQQVQELAWWDTVTLKAKKTSLNKTHPQLTQAKN